MKSHNGCQKLSINEGLIFTLNKDLPSVPLAFFQFIDDPFLKSKQSSCPVQLPLAVSGWGFKEEFSPSPVKIEKVEEDCEPMDSAVEGNFGFTNCQFY